MSYLEYLPVPTIQNLYPFSEGKGGGRHKGGYEWIKCQVGSSLCKGQVKHYGSTSYWYLVQDSIIISS